MHGDAEIVGRSVEFREKQVLGGAGVVSAGEQQFERLKLLAVGDPSLVAIEAARLGGQFRPLHLCSSFRDHVDYGEKGVGTVKGRNGTADDLYPVNEINIEDELCSQVGPIVHVVIQAVPIHEQQNAGVVISRPIETAYTHVAVVAVVSNVEAAHAAQYVG